MMITEFEKLTGIFPTSDLYKAIETAYNEYDGNKADFCKAYKENTDGIAEKIQRAADMASVEKALAEDEQVAKMKAEVESLKKELDAEQEWKPYVDTDNFQQAPYDELKTAGGTRILTDEEAKDLLYDWYGFAREKVKILRELPAFEVNRHRVLRKVGVIERLPLYNATDWNYIRFDCGCMAYELINDKLRPFLH